MVKRILISYAILAVTLLFARAQEVSPGALVRQLNQAYIDVFEKVSPSVVVIEIEKTASSTRSPLDLFGLIPRPDLDEESLPRRPETSEGSGIVARPDGYIYTNSHVVEGGGKITVKLKDGREFPAKLIGADSYTDIAVLKIEVTNLPAARFGNSDEVKVGQIACVIGSPYNFAYSFTTGVISAKGRNKILDSRWSGLFEDFLQTDASINPGNSGGPLLDIEGQVVGMNAIIQGFNRGLGFSISSNLLQRIGGEIIANGKVSRAWIGIGIQSLKDLPPDRFGSLKNGVRVQSISSESPAYKSELRTGDIILKVDNVPVAESIDLQREVQRKKVGQKLQLAVWRDGQELTLAVATAELPTEARAISRSQPAEPEPEDEAQPETIPSIPSTPDGQGDEKEESPAPSPLGLEVQALTPDLALAKKSKAQSGWIVTDSTPGTEAAVAGIKVGDIITEINGQAVTSADSLTEILKQRTPGKSTLLLVERDGNTSYVVLKSAD